MERNLLFQTVFTLLSLCVIIWLIVYIQIGNLNQHKNSNKQLVDITNGINEKKVTFIEIDTKKSVKVSDLEVDASKDTKVSDLKEDAKKGTAAVNKNNKLTTDVPRVWKLDHEAEAELDKLNEEKVKPDDPRLVWIIQKHFIVPPSNLPYNLSEMDKLDTSMGQAAFVDNRLDFKEGGFFVESGAHDGEYLSNTLFLERQRQWTGVLIEPLPKAFQQLQNKRRQAYSINACLSLRPYPSKETLTTEPVLGKVLNHAPKKKNWLGTKTVQVQCFPLYSILLAFNRINVDFLSLDVEGAEVGVLSTVPWSKVNITMMAVEYDKWPGGSDNLCKYMSVRGYECVMTLKAAGAADVIFKKKKLKKI